MAKLETELKRHVRHKRLTVWSESYEPSLRGGGNGVPDTQVLLCGLLFPIEFKVGFIEKGLLRSSVRPAQISWNAKFSRAGGIALLLVGVECQDDWMIYLMPGAMIGEIEAGVRYDKRIIKCITPEQNLNKKLVEYINDEWEGVLRHMDKRWKRNRIGT